MKNARWVGMAVMAAGLWAGSVCGEPAAGGFNRGPYLVWPTKTSMTIVCETDEPGEATVRYGEDGKTDRTLAVKGRPFDYKLLKEGVAKGTKRGWLKDDMLRDKSAFEYRAELKDLKSGTAYTYVVEASGGKSESRIFKTFPDKAEKFTFIVYGDSQDNPDIHARMAANFLRHEPAFILHVGDFQDCGEYVFWNEQHFVPLRDVIDRVPLFPTQGDHDSGRGYRWAFAFSEGAPVHYAFEYGHMRVASLFVPTRPPDAKQLAWLKNVMTESPATWRVVFGHAPQYDVNLLCQLNVDLAFNGDLHVYRRWFPRVSAQFPGHALTALTVGPAGGGPRGVGRKNEDIAVAKSCQNFVVVDVDGEKITMRAMDENGEEFDRVSWSKPGGKIDAEYMTLAKPASLAPAKTTDGKPSGGTD